MNKVEEIDVAELRYRATLKMFYIVTVGIYELPGELAMFFIVKAADDGGRVRNERL
ncbi:hypothetical protein [Paenibacillus sp. Soil724D2]|uniref:hypothetical protein n=1 Tax=Paenibacillus sp. (strain Soil724D2) TaxID=1736392 RepID=UPI000B0E61CD|nr:hypothetical protein [Paenibacillus sp. Soil724D2]